MVDEGIILPDMLPEAFRIRMRDLLTESEYAAFLSCYGQKRFYSLRINPLKADREQVLRLFEQENLQPVPWEPDGFYYPEDFRPGRLPLHEAGMYYIQEASAMLPAVLCDVKPGDRVLDLCVAPGGKSTKLAACLQGKGILVANEIHPERAKVLSSNLERMGVRNALVTNETPQSLASRFPLFFDRIVVDAPCSGEGMFRKEEEALIHWSPENVRMCAERQLEILEEASSMLRAGGRLVYSTCTFSPEENEGVIFRFLMDHPDFSVVSVPDLPGIRAEEWGLSCGRPDWLSKAGIDAASFGSAGPERAEELRGTIRLWPHLLKGEGHFAAVLRKDDPQSAPAFRQAVALAVTAGSADGRGDMRIQTSRAGNEKGRKRKEKSKGKKQGRGNRQDGESSLREMQRMWETFCSEFLLFTHDSYDSHVSHAVTDFGVENLCMFGKALFCLPGPAAGISMDGLRVLRAGLHLGTVNRGRFEPSHALAMALGRDEVCRFAEFGGDSPRAYAWIRGESVSVNEECGKGWTLVFIDGCSIGWGKVNGGILKNHYPKGLRKGSSYRPNG